MENKITLSPETVERILELINKAIEEEINFPSRNDDWMNSMIEAEKSISQADCIIIGR